jgi:intergrase/recombinase
MGWFCVTIGELGVQDRYMDAFCGRLPASVLARHYTDYSSARLKAIYDRANLRALD